MVANSLNEPKSHFNHQGITDLYQCQKQAEQDLLSVVSDDSNPSMDTQVVSREQRYGEQLFLLMLVSEKQEGRT